MLGWQVFGGCRVCHEAMWLGPLGKDADFDVVLLLVDVDREVLELVDELVDVLGLDLPHVEVHPVGSQGSSFTLVLGDG